MKTLLMLMGQSGSGKSYLEQKLTFLYPDVYKKIVSVTTRSPREGEINGKDYHFVSDGEFVELEKSNQLIQQTKFAGISYGSLASEYECEQPIGILVVVPKSAAEFIPILKKRYPDITVVITYFDISQERIRQNMLSRGDSEESIEKRLAHDTLSQDFKETGLTASAVIVDNSLNDNLPIRYHNWVTRRFLKPRE